MNKLKLWLALTRIQLSEYLRPSKKDEKTEDNSNNYKTSDLSSIRANEGTDVPKYTIRGHSLTTRLSGNDISVGDNWNWIEPQFRTTQILPGMSYLPNNTDSVEIAVQSVSDDAGHIITPVLTGNDRRNWADMILIEPQFDRINVKPGTIYKKIESRNFRETIIPPLSDRDKEMRARAEFYFDKGNDSLIHRDVKPKNILLSGNPNSMETQYQLITPHRQLDSILTDSAKRAANPMPLKINVGDFDKNPTNLGNDTDKRFTYEHKEAGELREWDYVGKTLVTSRDFEKVILYNNKAIIAFQNTITSKNSSLMCGPYTVVPGEILRYKYDVSIKHQNTPITEVRPIDNLKEQSEVETILRENNFKGTINFWISKYL